MNNNDQAHFILQTRPLFSALEQLNNLSDRVMTLIVTDARGAVTGTLTDGDIRRALLNGESLQTRIATAMHTDCRVIAPGDDPIAALREARAKGIDLIPVVDSQRRPVSLLDLRQTVTMLPLSAILMAGGRGERLRPLTLDTPKPLLKVGNRPIIDYNIEMMARAGITDITVTTNYLAEQLDAHFAAPVAGVSVKTVREPMALGTIGSASLVKRDNPDGATLIMNSDLLTSVNLEEMWLRHTDNHADITIAAVPYNVSVPYAVLMTDGAEVKALTEKPSMSFWANAGIYIIANRLLDSLSADRRTDATDLIEQAIAHGRRVVYYPLKGTWIDIGSPADYRHACDLMSLDTPLQNQRNNG